METTGVRRRVLKMACVVRRETELQSEGKSEELAKARASLLGSYHVKPRARGWTAVLSGIQSLVATHAPWPKCDRWCPLLPLARPLKEQPRVALC